VPAAMATGTTRLSRWHVLGAALVLAGVLVSAALFGAIDLDWHRVIAEVVAQLTGGVSPLTEQESAILWQLRMPRVVLGGLVGAALACSGATFQGVFRNPLADPYLLGAAAGAGMVVTGMVVLAPHTPASFLPVAAFTGSIGGVGLTWTLGRSAGSGTAHLLLAGVAVASFLTAVQTFVQQLNTDTLQRVYGFILGGLATTGWNQVLAVLPYLVVTSIVLCACAGLLDVLALGDEEATSLGIRPGLVRALVLGAASLATAAAVSVSGLIGFVGIVVPHLIRLLFGASYRVVVPLSLVGGAVFLMVADVVARTALAPAELPIGVVTAFSGAPFFILVLRATGGRRS